MEPTASSPSSNRDKALPLLLLESEDKKYTRPNPLRNFKQLAQVRLWG